MFRFINFILIGGLLSAAGFLYSVKYEAAGDTGKITKLTREIAKEQDKINRLNAEWAYLNRPEYLQPIVEKHLDMRPMTISQIGASGLRERQPPAIDPLTRMLENLERADRDVITAKLKDKKPLKPTALPLKKPVLSLKPKQTAKPQPKPKMQTLADVIAGLDKPKGKVKP
jgi:hypothetical protein